jgi:hypothetical protein
VNSHRFLLLHCNAKTFFAQGLFVIFYTRNQKTATSTNSFPFSFAFGGVIGHFFVILTEDFAASVQFATNVNSL